MAFSAWQPVFTARRRAYEARHQASARCLHLHGAVGEIRTAFFHGTPHLVLPVVAMVEGVIWPVNAPKPEMVPAASFSAVPQGWNGRPVFYSHPTVDGAQVSGNSPELLTLSIGQVFHARIDGKRLLMEAWVDPEKAKAVGGDELVELLMAAAAPGRKVVEVSVGAFVMTDQAEGTFGDQRYAAIWREVTPDHLALLPPTDEGACNAAMGCGIRAATMHYVTAESIRFDAQEGSVDIKKQSMWERLTGVLRALGHWDDELGESDQDRQRTLQDALKKAEPSLTIWIEAVYDEYVVYSAYSGGANVSGGPSKYYQRSYTINDATGEVAFGQTTVEVEPVMHYEPIEIVTAKGARHSSTDVAMIQAMHDHAVELGATCAPIAAASGQPKETDMTRCERIAAVTKLLTAEAVAKFKAAAKASSDLLTAIVDQILANKDLPFTEDDRLWLEAANEARLVAFAGFTPGEKKTPAAGDGAAAGGAAASTAAQAPAYTGAQGKAAQAEKKPQTEEEFLAAAPQSLRDLVAGAKAREHARRDELVTVLKTAQTEYAEAELKAMPAKDLERIARVCKAAVKPVDFSGQGLPRTAETPSYAPPDPYLAGIKAMQAATH